MSNKATESATITIRIPVSLQERLEILGKATNRSRSFLAADAIERYVATEEWQVAGIQQALEDKRPGIPDEQVAAWMAKLGTDKPLAVPKSAAGKKARQRK